MKRIFVLTVVLLLVSVAGATAAVEPPSPARLAAKLVSVGAEDARCIAVKSQPGLYVCAFDYKANCYEFEFAWKGRGMHFANAPLASKRGHCAFHTAAPAS